MECEHFPGIEPEYVRCSICIHGLAVEKEVKPTNWWIPPSTGLTVDPGDAILEGIVDGSVCPRCLTSRVPIGCSCDRTHVFFQDMQDATAFLDEAPERGIIHGVEWNEVMSQHLVASVFKRASRRVDWESDDERADVRRGLLLEYGVDPSSTKWFPPRITEPTHLPV